MTADHVKPLLENSVAESLCLVAELLSRGHIPHGVLSVVRMGRFTALQTPMGLRGVVAGDILRRLMARTVARQIRQQVGRATGAMHCACSTGPHRSRSPVHSPFCRWNRRVRHHFSKCHVARIETHEGRRGRSAICSAILWRAIHLFVRGQ